LAVIALVVDVKNGFLGKFHNGFLGFSRDFSEAVT
jgi:hypothetical protein